MKSYLTIKKKRLIQIIELEDKLFNLLPIKNGEINISEYRKIQAEIEENIIAIRKQISLW